MGEGPPALRLEEVRAEGVLLDLAVKPGELLLLRVPSLAVMRGMTELCCGLRAVEAGAVRLLGRDLAALSEEERRLLRARVGVVPADLGFAPHLSVAESVLLPALAHRAAPLEALRERAAALCRRFGLPGLPLGRPRDLRETDLVRAACARAFLLRPSLLLLEDPIRDDSLSDLWLPLLDAMAGARRMGCLWMTTSAAVWADPGIPAAARCRLTHAGIERSRRVAA